MQLINASELKLDEQYQTIYTLDNVKISKESNTNAEVIEEQKTKVNPEKNTCKSNSNIVFKIIKVLILSLYDLFRKNKLTISIILIVLIFLYRKKYNLIHYFKGILY